jgi:hypothetical protein
MGSLNGTRREIQARERKRFGCKEEKQPSLKKEELRNQPLFFPGFLAPTVWSGLFSVRLACVYALTLGECLRKDWRADPPLLYGILTDAVRRIKVVYGFPKASLRSNGGQAFKTG